MKIMRLKEGANPTPSSSVVEEEDGGFESCLGQCVRIGPNTKYTSGCEGILIGVAEDHIEVQEHGLRASTRIMLTSISSWRPLP